MRGQNIEYINFIKRSLEITKIAEQKPRENLSILELGCGSGPLGAKMIDWGYSVEFSDYSDVLIERLRKEFGYKAFTADCRDLSFAKDNSYDVVLLAGTVYNFENYYSAEKVYSEINRILKSRGVFIHFLNQYLSSIDKIYSSRLAQNIKWNFNPLNLIKKTNFLRRVLGKPPAKKSHHFWRYPPEEIQGMLCSNNFEMVSENEFFGVESKLCEKFNFLAKNRQISNQEFHFSSIAFFKREECISRLGILISNYLRKYCPSLCSDAVGFVAIKRTEEVGHIAKDTKSKEWE